MCFMQTFKMTIKNAGKTILTKLADDSADTLGVKNLVEIALSGTVSKINALLHFMQNSRWLSKMAGKRFLAKSGREFSLLRKTRGECP